MRKMQYITRNGRSPQGLQRVYFTGYPDKLEYWREQIAAQILERHNCAVFYETDPEKPEDKENFEADLSRMQLIVIPVTGAFLMKDCFARRAVFAFAMQRHIPVLPIFVEPELPELFDRICGDLQYLDMTAQDDTAIPYEEKLTRYLNSVLIGDETAQKIRDAYDAYIFMSYRKKDRRFAQELMRLIHRNEFCRDIAIWYDEFLVPGESFNDAIRQAMQKSRLFALVVTPNLLEQGNYIMTHEYPDACSAGMKILPAELQPTDRPALEAHYAEIPPCVDSHDLPVLAESLAVLLADAVKPSNDSGEDPAHDYFVGLGYLGGIDVETDYKTALELITRAAEHDLPEAMQKLADMYNSGEGVQRDYHKAIEWQRKLAARRGRLFAEDPSEDNGADWLNTLWNLGKALEGVGKPAEAQDVYAEMLHWSEDCLARGFGFAQRYVPISYINLGDICKAQGRLPEAWRHYEKSLQISEQLAEETGTVQARRDLSVGYERLGDICQAQCILPEAWHYSRKSLQIREQLAEETGTVQARRDLSVICSILGDICQAQGRLQEAQKYYEKSLHICEQLAEETRTAEARCDLSIGYSKLGFICKEQGRLQEAQQYYGKSLQIREQLAEETGTVQARRNLSVSCGRLGDICQAQGRMAEARQYYEKSLLITEQLADEIRTVQVRDDFSVICNCLGAICQAQGRLPEARQYYEKSLQIAEQLAKETESVQARLNLTCSCNNLGLICESQGRLPEAQRYFEKSTQIAEQLAEETGTIEARHDLSICYGRLGSIWHAQGRLPEAREYYEQSLQIREQLAEETGTVHAWDELSVSYENLGKIYQEQGRLPEARQYYESSLTICAQLAEKTGTPQAWDNLAVSYYYLGCIAEDQAHRKECFSQALQIWKALAEQFPDNPEYANKRDIILEKL